MRRPPFQAAPKPKTLADQKADFTEEGAPPLGKLGSAIPDAVFPALPGDAKSKRRSGVTIKAAPTEVPPLIPPSMPPPLPTSMPRPKPAVPTPEPTPGPAPTPVIEPKPTKIMKQAERDITRGLKDTDRGPESGHTYKKLKQTM